MSGADELAGSAQLPAATAVEVVQAPAPVGFVHGIATGVAVTVIVLQALLAYELAPFRDMYRDFAGGVPVITRVVLSSTWRWGMPAAGAVVVAGLIVFRPRSVWAYAAFSVVTIGVAIATWYVAQMPIYELAGNISAD